MILEKRKSIRGRNTVMWQLLKKPWSHAYKLATGKLRTNSIMTTLRKPDATVTSSILETMNTMLDHLITDNGEEENQRHKNIRKMI